jgi:D-alanyl-lipoteichoic acid acyltransferase DltB (MBOAT superfamily)
MPDVRAKPTGAEPFVDTTSASDAQGPGRISGVRPRAFTILPAVLTLALLVTAAVTFQLEGEVFYELVFPLAAAGFVIQAFLRRELRLPFFVALSFIGLAAAFGLRDFVRMTFAGCVLIGICHLRIRWSARVALLVVVGATLAYLRLETPAWLWGVAVWPVLGSMFMLRLISYMHELKHRREPMTSSQALAYFFMLPNLAFPLFPVVDNATFRRTYYEGDEAEIYGRGLQWIARGFVQLVLFRVVYMHLLSPSADVATPADLVRYLVANFFLYLRVSGQFHVAVGILHLFGFRLPETHRMYFLSASFSDFWRRINIYWKDFLLKVIYVPAHTALRRRMQARFSDSADRVAIVGATLLVFVVTWVLHAAQWFWIMGTWLFTLPDILFWGILAVLLTANALRESRNPGRPQSWRSWRELPAFALRILLTFTAISVLWALWSSESLWEFGWTMAALVGPKSNLGLLVPAVIAVVVALWILLPTPPTSRRLAGGGSRPQSGTRTMLVTATTAGVLALVGGATADAVLPARAVTFLASIRSPELNRADAEYVRLGYYEELTGGQGMRRVNVWGAEAAAEAVEHRWDEDKALRSRNDFLMTELQPSVTAPAGGALASFNSAGMRDREFAKSRTAGTYRVAVLGASYVWGSGVKDDETFDNRLEARLNAERPDPRVSQYEILNFAVPAYSPGQQLYQLEFKVLEYRPDAILFVTHPAHGNEAVTHLAKVISESVPIPESYHYLRDLAWRAGVQRGLPVHRGERLLKPHQNDILKWTFERAVALCRAAGVRPVWVLLGTPGYPAVEEENRTLVRLATEAGFEIIDFSHLYDGFDVRTLQISKWDIHPNARGHQLIADTLARMWPRIGPKATVRPR